MAIFLQKPINPSSKISLRFPQSNARNLLNQNSFEQVFPTYTVTARYLVLSSIADQSLGVGESDIAWCSAVALVVGNYLHLAVLKHSHTRVCRAQINSNCWSFRHSFCNRYNQLINFHQL